jgi:hypothetical protein
MIASFAAAKKCCSSFAAAPTRAFFFSAPSMARYPASSSRFLSLIP